MGQISSKLRKWTSTEPGQEGVTYWCQGCKNAHSIIVKGPGAWGWNGNAEKPVFTPSVLSKGHDLTPAGRAAWEQWHAEGCPSPAPSFERAPSCCHTFVGCNGAQPGEVIFLGDCTHELAGTVQPFADLPEWMLDKDGP